MNLDELRHLDPNLEVSVDLDKLKEDMERKRILFEKAFNQFQFCRDEYFALVTLWNSLARYHKVSTP